MKSSLHALSFAAGILFATGLLTALPVLPQPNHAYLLHVPNETSLDVAMCNSYTTGLGRRGYGSRLEDGQQAHCVVTAFGHFQPNGDFVSARENRTPLDLFRKGTVANVVIPKARVLHACELDWRDAPTNTPGCLELAKWDHSSNRERVIDHRE